MIPRAGQVLAEDFYHCDSIELGCEDLLMTLLTEATRCAPPEDIFLGLMRRSGSAGIGFGPPGERYTLGNGGVVDRRAAARADGYGGRTECATGFS
jgi:hypothetical protein